MPSSRPSSTPAAPAPTHARLRDIAHVALDMDGTIYKGGTLFSCTLPFIAQMRELGIGCTFLTNNPSKSASDYLTHLRKMGLAATADELYTSAQATIDCLRRRFPEVKKNLRPRDTQHARRVSGRRI
jgi:ribonucleotide monophosphatase NagD (HAD superfamily)